MRWALGFCLTFLGCSGRQTTEPVKADPTPVSPEPTDLPSPAPSVSPSEIFPLALLTTVRNGVEAHCMASYFGDDVLVTAGHCLATLAAAACENGSLTVNWAAQANGAAEKVGPRVACVGFEGALSNAPEADLGIVHLGPGTLRPAESLHFATEPPSGDQRLLFLWGPPTSLDDFSVAIGRVIGQSFAFLTHNAGVSPGFSGSPIFVLPEVVAPGTPFPSLIPEALRTGVVGIHTGYVGGVPGAITAALARERILGR